MEYLTILVQNPLKVGIIDGTLLFPTHLCGQLYKQDLMPETIVFFDWLTNETGEVKGLEIHLPVDDSLLRSMTPLSTIRDVEVDCFPRFWLSPDRDGRPQGLEAFDGLFFAHSREGDLAIFVDLRKWLSESQTQQLSQRFPHMEI